MNRQLSDHKNQPQTINERKKMENFDQANKIEIKQ